MMISVCERRLAISPRASSRRQAEREHAAADDRRRLRGEIERRQHHRDSAGARGDDAESGEDIETEIAGFGRRQRLQALGVGRL